MNQPNHPRSEQSLSERIVAAVAEHEGVDPIAVAEPLYEAIDPESLEILFARDPERNNVEELTFVYAGCRVTVYGDTSISVEDDGE